MLELNIMRLREELDALAPIDTVRYRFDLPPGSTEDPLVVTFLPEATQGQIDAAQAFIAAFDWSDPALQQWLDSKRPNRSTLRQQADAAIIRLDQIINAANFTNAQVIAAIKDMALYEKHIIKRLIEID